MKTLQALATWVAVGTGLLAVGLGVMWGARSLNSVATSVTVHTPEAGVHCAVAVTDDGVAIDCWKVPQ